MIVSTAIDLVSDKGPRALTLRALGAKLGVQFTTIYNYFPNATELSNEVVRALLSSVPMPDTHADKSLTTQLVDHYVALREVLVRHPDVLDRTPGSPSWMWSLAKLDAELGILTSAGIPLANAIVLVGSLNGVCAASASLSRTWGSDQSGALKRRLLAGMKPAQFPNLNALTRLPAGALSTDESFRSTLKLLLDNGLKLARAKEKKA